jgi:hypothetical protein
MFLRNYSAYHLIHSCQNRRRDANVKVANFILKAIYLRQHSRLSHACIM